MENIDVNSLQLSNNNPRLFLNENSDVFEEMIHDQGTKIIALAEDIIEYGLNPTEFFAVYPSETKGKFIVAEGNRRLTAIKIINEPTLIERINKSYFDRIKKVISGRKIQIGVVSCHVFQSYNDPYLHHWLAIKHMGNNDGKGTIKWDSYQKQHYIKDQTGNSRLLDLHNELVSLGILQQFEIDSISKTNWERLLGKTGMRYLGLSLVKSKYIIPTNNIEIFTLKIRKICEKLSYQTVRIVYDNKGIQALLNEVNKDLYGEVNLLIGTNTETLFNEIEISGFKNQASSDFLEISEEIEVEKFPIDLFDRCNTIIPPKLTLSSSNIRINSIINELKKLNPSIYPNSCGLLLRALFELSSKYYMESKNNSDLTDIKFNDIISMASSEMYRNHEINKGIHSSINQEKDKLRLLFNGYAHDTDAYPSADILKNYFKTHLRYIECCLRNRGKVI